MSRKLKIRVPGSSGNLGPGFDTLALSLNVYCKLSLYLDKSINDGPIIELEGSASQGLSTDKDNLVIQYMENYLENAGKNTDILKNLRLTIDNDIPLARGLGSSSAAGIGALFATKWLLDQDLDMDECVQIVAKKEGHAENACASALGGVVTVCRPRQGDYQYLTLPWPESWSTIVVVPPYEVSTPVARGVLPRSVGLNQAVTNIQNTSMLIASIISEDAHLLKSCLTDSIHEQYRESLVPELSTLKLLLRNGPALGTVLSGAGSSILVLVEESDKQEVMSTLNWWKTQNNKNALVLDLSVDSEGLVVEDD